MDIKINNCNNIDSGNISLTENKLNIKFAPNGTGKSTIARSIILETTEGSNLDELIPFKLRESNPEDKAPAVNGLENIQSVMCFNEEYLNQFVFQQEELLSNSFDILIKSDAYKQKEQEIEELVAEIKQLFVGNEELENLITTLNELGAAFKKTRTGLSKSSSGMKGLAGGNVIQHIPEGLESYQPFIQSQESSKWVAWQTSGYDYTDLSENCPFCTSHVADKKDQIRKVGKKYDKNVIKNLVAILGVIEELGDYFSVGTRSNLTTITTLSSGLEVQHIEILATVKNQIDIFLNKLEKLRKLSGFQFKEGEQVADKLPEYRLDLDCFPALNSERMQQSINPINAALDSIIVRAGQLHGKIVQQRIEMQRVIEKHQKDINGFLSYAGYNYKVEISGEGDKAQLKLLHIHYTEHLKGGNQHLSFGERNAFAIVLFMYECLSHKPDLIILDDPISSFDKNKKYAILEMLFRRDASICFKNKTVLMLTHDIEPIIDTVKALHSKFSGISSASFLKLTEGIITEQSISRDDIQTFAEICKNALGSDKDDVIKLIYLRRHYEITDDKGDAYQVLSNLLHKRVTPKDSREDRGGDGHYPDMENSKFTSGCTDILEKWDNFHYPDLLNRIIDLPQLLSVYADCTSGYEKLQVYRLIGLKGADPVTEKFINETYHIENEFICQLDPAAFDTIPQYVITECDKIVITNS